MKHKTSTPLLLLAAFLVGCSNNGQKLSNCNSINKINDPNHTHERVIHYEDTNPTFFKPGHIEFYYCLDCQKSFYDYKCENEIPNSQYSVTNKLDGRYISPLTKNINIVGENIRQYLSAETDAEIIAALKNTNAGNNDQVTNTFSWSGDASGSYKVELSDDRSFTEYKTIATSTNSVALDRTLTPGETYYYRIKKDNKIIFDDLSFKVNDTYSLRPIYVDGLNNVRDLGGWKTEDGKTIKYGKLFRGAFLNNITEKGKDIFFNDLGIKTEIDVRTDGGQTLFDSRLTYHQCGMWQYTNIIPDFQLWNSTSSAYYDFDTGSPAAIKNIFDLLADQSNYPIYYHCTAGADRTGTISYLINGLLGVSYEDLTKDFELTSFSIQGPRWRDSVTTEGDAFTGSGIYSNEGNMIAWGKLNQLMITRYGDETNNLSKAIENYLINVCGVSIETINSFKEIML